MADYTSIAATGRSLVRFLNHCFTEENPHPLGNTTTAVLIRSEDFKPSSEQGSAPAIEDPALSIFFYRVECNRATRAGWSATGNYEGRAYLPLDLYFLITPWAKNAEYELSILGRAMQCLEQTPILTGPLLDELGAWAPGEAIQVSLAELSTEEVMRTFDSLPHDFKLSVPYVARVVRIDQRHAVPAPDSRTVEIGGRAGASLGTVLPPTSNGGNS